MIDYMICDGDTGQWLIRWLLLFLLLLLLLLLFISLCYSYLCIKFEGTKYVLTCSVSHCRKCLSTLSADQNITWPRKHGPRSECKCFLWQINVWLLCCMGIYNSDFVTNSYGEFWDSSCAVFILD